MQLNEHEETRYAMAALVACLAKAMAVHDDQIPERLQKTLDTMWGHINTTHDPMPRGTLEALQWARTLLRGR